MHTIDLLEESLWLASQSGWQVRHEWLQGMRGGACRLGNKHMLFVDRSLTAAEQLEQVLEGMRDQLQRHDEDPFTRQFIECLNQFVLSHHLRRALGLTVALETAE